MNKKLEEKPKRYVLVYGCLETSYTRIEHDVLLAVCKDYDEAVKFAKSLKVEDFDKYSFVYLQDSMFVNYSNRLEDIPKEVLG